MLNLNFHPSIIFKLLFTCFQKKIQFNQSLHQIRRGLVGKTVALAAEGRRFESSVK